MILEGFNRQVPWLFQEDNYRINWRKIVNSLVLNLSGVHHCFRQPRQPFSATHGAASPIQHTCNSLPFETGTFTVLFHIVPASHDDSCTCLSVYILKYVIYRQFTHEFCFRILKRGVSKHVLQKWGAGSDRLENYCTRWFLKFCQVRKCQDCMKLLSLEARSFIKFYKEFLKYIWNIDSKYCADKPRTFTFTASSSPCNLPILLINTT